MPAFLFGKRTLRVVGLRDEDVMRPQCWWSIK
jgi:hypothetical protein